MSSVLSAIHVALITIVDFHYFSGPSSSVIVWNSGHWLPRCDLSSSAASGWPSIMNESDIVLGFHIVVVSVLINDLDLDVD
jgi:hypothetical protein